ncbi:MAG: glycosyltransferase family 39 protein [Candidatus Omnitrophica bacterium]|nr:glycosyltransferase family 39 protein [Candidatus Omnitrophota bacterium]
MTSNRKILFLVITLGIAFLLRVLWILPQDHTVNIWTDWWDELAWNLATGKGYMVTNPFFSSGVAYYSWRPPLFPIFLASVYTFFGHSYLAAKLALAIISTLSVLLVYRLASRLFDQTHAQLASGICAIYPSFIFFTGYLAPETLTMFCLLTFADSLTSATQSRVYWRWFLAGVWLGACILCRTIMILFFIFVLLWMAIQRMKWKYLTSAFAIFILGMVLTIIPWIWRNWRIHGVFLLHSTDSGQALYINNNPRSFSFEPSGTAFTYDPIEIGRLTELEATRVLSARAITFIKNYPEKFALYIWRRFLNFWRPFPYTVSGPGRNYTFGHQIFSLLYTGPVLFLAAVVLFTDRKQWARLSLILFLIVYYSGTYILVRAIIRYRIPLEPFLIILAVHGFISLSRWRKTKDGNVYLL